MKELKVIYNNSNENYNIQYDKDKSCIDVIKLLKDVPVENINENNRTITFFYDTLYKSIDGKFVTTKKECIEYEDKLKKDYLFDMVDTDPAICNEDKKIVYNFIDNHFYRMKDAFSNEE